MENVKTELARKAYTYGKFNGTLEMCVLHACRTSLVRAYRKAQDKYTALYAEAREEARKALSVDSFMEDAYEKGYSDGVKHGQNKELRVKLEYAMA